MYLRVTLRCVVSLLAICLIPIASSEADRRAKVKNTKAPKTPSVAALVDVGDEWWCAGDEGLCYRHMIQCDAYRSFTEQNYNIRVSACVSQSHAAVLRFKDKLTGRWAFSAHPTIKDCKKQRNFLLTAAREDVAATKPCVSVGQTSGTRAGPVIIAQHTIAYLGQPKVFHCRDRAPSTCFVDYKRCEFDGSGNGPYVCMESSSAFSSPVDDGVLLFRIRQECLSFYSAAPQSRGFCSELRL